MCCWNHPDILSKFCSSGFHNVLFFFLSLGCQSRSWHISSSFIEDNTSVLLSRYIICSSFRVRCWTSDLRVWKFSVEEFCPPAKKKNGEVSDSTFTIPSQRHKAFVSREEMNHITQDFIMCWDMWVFCVFGILQCIRRYNRSGRRNTWFLLKTVGVVGFCSYTLPSVSVKYVSSPASVSPPIKNLSRTSLLALSDETDTVDLEKWAMIILHAST